MLREKLTWRSHDARVPMQDTGTDVLVVVKKLL